MACWIHGFVNKPYVRQAMIYQNLSGKLKLVEMRSAGCLDYRKKSLLLLLSMPLCLLSIGSRAVAFASVLQAASPTFDGLSAIRAACEAPVA